jgi:hypothetical protein
MKNDSRVTATSKHQPDYQDGASLKDKAGFINWSIPLTDELAQLNNVLNNPNCKNIVIGERKGGNPGLVQIGGEINPYSHYQWHSLFPRPVVIENSPLDQSTWFRAMGNVSTRDYTYTAYVSTRYAKSFLLNGHFMLLEPTFNADGAIVGGMRVSVQTIRRKNINLWEILLEQQSDNREVFGQDDYLTDTSTDMFSWAGASDVQL